MLLGKYAWKSIILTVKETFWFVEEDILNDLFLRN